MFALRAVPTVDPRFLVRDFEPAYLRLYRSGALSARVEAALQELEDCCACPRNCHVNRLRNETRLCHTGRHAIVSSAFPHFGEEDCLRGWNGSGTIFFGLCNLRCVFCQNWDISQQRAGRECTNAPPGRTAALRAGRPGAARAAGAPPGHAGSGRRGAGDPRLAGAGGLRGHLCQPHGPVPAYQVETGGKYIDIDRRPSSRELDTARAAARAAGLWRVDRRWGR